MECDRSPKLQPEQTALLDALGFRRLPPYKKARCSLAIRILGCTSVEEIQGLTPDCIRHHVHKHPRTQHARTAIHALMALAGRAGIMKEIKPVCKRVKRLPRPTPKQQQWSGSMSTDPHVCGAMLYAMRVLEVESVDDVYKLTNQDVLSRLASHGNCPDHTLAVNKFLHAIGQQDKCTSPFYRQKTEEKTAKNIYQLLDVSSLKSYDRMLIRTAIRCLGCTTVQEIQEMPLSVVCERVLTFPIKRRSRRSQARHSVNALMRLIDRPVYITKRLLSNHISQAPSDATAPEKQWVQDHKDIAEAYWTMRDKLRVDMIQTRCLGPATVRKQLCIMGRLLRRLLPQSNTLQVTTSQVLDAIAGIVIEATESKSSLVNRRRQSRDSERANPIQYAANEFCNTATEFMRVMGIESVNRRTMRAGVWSRVSQHPVVRQFGDNALEEFQDCLTLDEMRATEAIADNIRDRLIVSLLMKLGMRSGGVRNLRLAGVVVNFNQLRPQLPTWVIRDQIAGADKGGKTLIHNISIHEELKERFNEYINDVWRPKYEHWIVSPDGSPKLRNGYVFPGKSAGTPLQPNSFSEIVKRLLRKAGVKDQRRTHAHAFRKGYITEMLRCGNSMEQVAEIVGHSSSLTTRKYYDKRSPLERLGKIKKPDWSGAMQAARAKASRGAVTDADTNKSTTTDGLTEQAMEVITEKQMEIEDLQDQLLVALKQLTPQQRDHWEVTCRARGTLGSGDPGDDAA